MAAQVKLVSTPSCGWTMLQAPADTFDYVLHVTSDDSHFVRVHCHKAVLRCHSPVFSNLMTGANYSELEVKLDVGFVGAFLELIQYMYLRDITLISHRQKVMKLCAMFDMPFDIFLIRTESIQPINTYRSLTFTLVSDRGGMGEASTCITSLDFLKHVEIHHAQLHVSEPVIAASLAPAPLMITVSVQTDTPSPVLAPVVLSSLIPPPPLTPFEFDKNSELTEETGLLVYQSDADETFPEPKSVCVHPSTSRRTTRSRTAKQRKRKH